VTAGGRGPGVELRVARFGQRIGGNEREAERRLKLKGSLVRSADVRWVTGLGLHGYWAGLPFVIGLKVY